MVQRGPSDTGTNCSPHTQMDESALARTLLEEREVPSQEELKLRSLVSHTRRLKERSNAGMSSKYSIRSEMVRNIANQ